MAFDIQGFSGRNSVPSTTDIQIVFHAHNGSFQPYEITCDVKDEDDKLKIRDAHLKSAKGHTMHDFQNAVMNRLGNAGVEGARVRFLKFVNPDIPAENVPSSQHLEIA